MKAAINSILDLIRREPALTIGLVAATLTLAASFGLNIGDQKQAAIMAFAQLIVAAVVRSQVTPTSKLPAA